MRRARSEIAEGRSVRRRKRGEGERVSAHSSREDLSNSSSTLFLFSSSSLIEREFQVKTDEKNKTMRHRSEKETEEKHNVAQFVFSFPSEISSSVDDLT